MEEVFRNAWKLFTTLLKNWPAVGATFGIVSWFYRRISKRQQNQLKDIQMHIKRLELLQAINNDYGLQVVSRILDDYEELGGNTYAHDLFEKYKKKKLEEEECLQKHF